MYNSILENPTTLVVGVCQEVLNEHVLGKTKRVKWYKITNDMEETCWFPETYFEIVEEEKYP